MKQNRILLCVVLFQMIFNILVPVLYAQQPLSEMSEEERNKKIKDAIEQHRKEKEKTRHPKVSSLLTDLEDEYNKGAEEAAKKFNAGEVLQDESGAVITKLEDAEKKGGGDAAKKFAKRNGIEIKDGNKTPVRITLGNGQAAETFDKILLESYGGEDIGGWGKYIGADIPVDKLRKIADEVEGIIWIERPTPAVPESFRSEGLSKIGFQNYSTAAIRGSGVKIAVIDIGFKYLSNAISNGDLPGNVTKIDCTSRSLGCRSDTFSAEATEHANSGDSLLICNYSGRVAVPATLSSPSAFIGDMV
ncbi:MAG: hypothetical protein Q7T53_10605 [Deltaproteobacteria bacterium]|nr:hypothetical protein [Deltaproteobacteria bacterium]